MVAANSGKTEYVRILAEKETGIQDEIGLTALMMAAKNDHAECVRVLVEKEAKM